MRTNSRGIDEQLCRWSASIGQGVEYPAPDAFVGPTLEAVVERLSRTVGSRCIHPAPTTLDDVDDAADHSSIIYARLATGVGRKMRLQLRELPIAQPEMISIHPSPPCGAGESHQIAQRNRFMGPDPNDDYVDLDGRSGRSRAGSCRSSSGPKLAGQQSAPKAAVEGSSVTTLKPTSRANVAPRPTGKRVTRGGDPTEFVEALPKNNYGTVRKTELRTLLTK